MKKLRPLCSSALMVCISAAFLFSNLALADDLLQEGVPPQIAKIDTKEADTVTMPRFDHLAEILSPMVVNISVETDTAENEEKKQENKETPMFLKRLPIEPIRSLGSGIIVTSDGYIVTNSHVIEKSSKIIVRLLHDKTEYIAELIGSDPKTDIALIKVNVDRELPAAYLGDSDKLKIGEWVLAIGNQFQLGQTVTAGIVSAKSRKVPTAVSGPYDNFIQTDASINPGSSGGPLFNSKGQVVGINTAIFSPSRTQFGGTGFNIGIGFSIPINMVKNVVPQLKTTGKVTRGLLGVIIQNVTPDVAEALGVRPEGALVAEVMPNTPAAVAGFKVKDILLSYAGHQIDEHDNLPILVANTPVDTVVDIEVWRDGKVMTLSPKIVEMKDSVFSSEDEVVKQDLSKKENVLGVEVQTLTAELAKAFALKEAGNVVVISVAKDSVADKLGIRRGDVIVELAGENIKNEEVFERVVKNINEDKPSLMLLRKNEGTRFLTIRLK